MGAAHALIWEHSYGAVTVETICERAKVKKGSFYYFFESKSDLAVAAIEEWWEERQKLVAEIFKPEIPPLERVRLYLDLVVTRQLANHQETGQILGCPLFTLGSEICTQEGRINTLLLVILRHMARLFEDALAEAMVAGDLPGSDVAQKARFLWAFYEGTLTRARIENNPELLRTLSADTLTLLGARTESVQPQLEVA